MEKLSTPVDSSPFSIEGFDYVSCNNSNNISCRYKEIRSTVWRHGNEVPLTSLQNEKKSLACVFVFIDSINSMKKMLRALMRQIQAEKSESRLEGGYSPRDPMSGGFDAQDNRTDFHIPTNTILPVPQGILKTEKSENSGISSEKARKTSVGLQSSTGGPRKQVQLAPITSGSTHGASNNPSGANPGKGQQLDSLKDVKDGGHKAGDHSRTKPWWCAMQWMTATALKM